MACPDFSEQALGNLPAFVELGPVVGIRMSPSLAELSLELLLILGDKLPVVADSGMLLDGDEDHSLASTHVWLDRCDLRQTAHYVVLAMTEIERRFDVNVFTDPWNTLLFLFGHQTPPIKCKL